MATAFNTYFIDSVKEIKLMFCPPQTVTHEIGPENPIFRLEQITAAEVANIIKSMKSSNAKDVNGLDTYFFFKHTWTHWYTRSLI